MTRMGFKRFSLLYGAVFALGACAVGDDALQVPSAVGKQPIQVEERSYHGALLLSEAGDDYLDALAAHYRRYSGSVMDLTVTYDPKSSRNTAMNASTRAGDLVSELRARGVGTVYPSILPVKGAGDEARLLVSYTAHEAKAPEECETLMPGVYDMEVRDNKDYKIGCSITALMARQVSRPSDLLGRGNPDTTSDGRTATNVVEVYRTGEPQEPLRGNNASGDE